jgi:hypothetical protein
MHYVFSAGKGWVKKQRIEFEGAICHITTRGNAREASRRLKRKKERKN